MAGSLRPWLRTVAVLMVLTASAATASGTAASTAAAGRAPAAAAPVVTLVAPGVGGRAGLSTAPRSAVGPVAAGWARPSVGVADAPGDGHAVPLDAGEAAGTFGVLVVDGGRHQCSAAMVVSDSRSLLATAAHCVWLGGSWTLEDAFFIPGYSAGREPFGRWAVDAAWVPRSWQAADSPIEAVASAHDVAFVRLAANADGELAQDVLGGQGIRFDAPAEPVVTAVGYPVAGAFDGEQLERCTGPARVERDAGSADGGEVLVLACDMTQGSSGGPWLVGDRSAAGWGQVIGVVSSGTGPELLSARYGPEAADAYQSADSGSGLDQQAERAARAGTARAGTTRSGIAPIGSGGGEDPR